MLIPMTDVALDATALDALAARLRMPDGYAADPPLAATLRDALEAARCMIEHETGRALTIRGFRVIVEAWGEGPELPVSPVRALTGVALIDAAGVETTLPLEDFRIDDFAAVPHARAASGAAPRVPPLGCAAVAFEAGYGPAWVDIPWELRAATLAQAAALYERGATQDAEGGLIPDAAILTAPYRRLRL
jgi:uncharacterized phiE125 gp8 family phage protein